jgi:hypothetical protein
VSAAGWPARYEIRVDGGLDSHWSEWFGGLQVTSDGGDTVLSGTLPDQAALHGVLSHVGSLGLSVIAVRRLPPEGPEAGRDASPGRARGP